LAADEKFELAYPKYVKKIQTYARGEFHLVPGYGPEELEAELLEILWLACERYDPNRGATFNTCFWQFAKNRVVDLKRSAFRKKRVANLNAETLEDEAVRFAVEERLLRSSAEDEALARLAVVERFRSKKISHN
jgi:hypothetical protein